ncbi:membrane hypothetical protein [Gammaproteobacteria bacterium]
MFNTHWIIIPLSFFPAGVACGFLGVTPEGVFFSTLLLSLLWQHLAAYFACRVFLKLGIGKFPRMELLIALATFVAGYIIALGRHELHIFSIAVLACAIFFLHDFILGLSLLIVRLMPPKGWDWDRLYKPLV